MTIHDIKKGLRIKHTFTGDRGTVSSVRGIKNKMFTIRWDNASEDDTGHDYYTVENLTFASKLDRVLE